MHAFCQANVFRYLFNFLINFYTLLLIYSVTFSTFLTFYTLLVLANLFRYFFRFIVTHCMSFVKAFQANVFRYLFNFLIIFYTFLVLANLEFFKFMYEKIKFILSNIMSYMKACYYWQYSSINYNEKHWFGNNQSAMKHLTSKLGLDNLKHK